MSSHRLRHLLRVGLVIGVLACFSACSEKSNDNNQAAQLAVLGLSSAFASSCNLTASNLCTNTYGVAASSASCTDAGGTYITTSKCTSSGAIGACRAGATETVFYSGNTSCSDDAACTTYCTNTLAGTYNADYVQ